MEFSKWCVRRGNGNRLTLLEPYSPDLRYTLYGRVLEAIRLATAPFDYLELGVYQGESLRWRAKQAQHPDSKLVGFDCFTGLPSAWEDKPGGIFSTGRKPPEIRDVRCSFRVGMFSDTLPPFMLSFDAKRQTIVHMDADIYTSTLFVLITIAPKLKPGDLLLVDEFCTPAHEFKAFREFASRMNLRHRLVGAVNRFTQVCLQII
ncbi:MAG TPA: TylF/MycF/NovP-related O-methyltransferase [Candidatus Acidoferrales bacterium]|nr:TylF/MycF/NovP-related O-methyltransferase [Candidatus Acidoferrales bacterium]